MGFPCESYILLYVTPYMVQSLLISLRTKTLMKIYEPDMTVGKFNSVKSQIR